MGLSALATNWASAPIKLNRTVPEESSNAFKMASSELGCATLSSDPAAAFRTDSDGCLNKAVSTGPDSAAPNAPKSSAASTTTSSTGSSSNLYKLAKTSPCRAFSSGRPIVACCESARPLAARTVGRFDRVSTNNLSIA